MISRGEFPEDFPFQGVATPQKVDETESRTLVHVNREEHRIKTPKASIKKQRKGQTFFGLLLDFLAAATKGKRKPDSRIRILDSFSFLFPSRQTLQTLLLLFGFHVFYSFALLLASVQFFLFDFCFYFRSRGTNTKPNKGKQRFFSRSFVNSSFPILRQLIE